MRTNVEKSWINIELSDGTRVEVEEKPYGSSLRGDKKYVNNFLFIKVKGVEVFKMFLSEVEEIK